MATSTPTPPPYPPSSSGAPEPAIIRFLESTIGSLALLIGSGLFGVGLGFLTMKLMNKRRLDQLKEYSTYAYTLDPAWQEDKKKQYWRQQWTHAWGNCNVRNVSFGGKDPGWVVEDTIHKYKGADIANYKPTDPGPVYDSRCDSTIPGGFQCEGNFFLDQLNTCDADDSVQSYCQLVQTSLWAWQAQKTLENAAKPYGDGLKCYAGDKTADGVTICPNSVPHTPVPCGSTGDDCPDYHDLMKDCTTNFNNPNCQQIHEDITCNWGEHTGCVYPEDTLPPSELEIKDCTGVVPFAKDFTYSAIKGVYYAAWFMPQYVLSVRDDRLGAGKYALYPAILVNSRCPASEWNDAGITRYDYRKSKGCPEVARGYLTHDQHGLTWNTPGDWIWHPTFPGQPLCTNKKPTCHSTNQRKRMSSQKGIQYDPINTEVDPTRTLRFFSSNGTF